MNTVQALIELQDLDQFAELVAEPARLAKLRKLGFTTLALDGLSRERERLLAAVDRRWLHLYERSLARYGRGLTAVRARVCQGCFITLPTSAAPPPGESMLHLCEGCARLLHWS